MPIPEELATAVGADVFINRLYWNADNNAVQIQTHLTVYQDWEKGMSRHPMKSLKADGWKLLAQNQDSVSTCKDNTIKVNLSEWERNYKLIRVLFWYQLGDRIFFRSSGTGADTFRAWRPGLAPPPGQSAASDPQFQRG